MKKPCYLVLACVVIAGCSNKSLYETGQNHQKNLCLRDAQTAEQHNRCLSEERKPFEEYEEERKAVVEK